MFSDLLILFSILEKSMKYVDEVISKGVIIINKEEEGMPALEV